MPFLDQNHAHALAGFMDNSQQQSPPEWAAEAGGDAAGAGEDKDDFMGNFSAGLDDILQPQDSEHAHTVSRGRSVGRQGGGHA